MLHVGVLWCNLCYETPPLYVVNLSKFQAAVTTADVATAIEETVGLRPGSVSAAEARSIFDLEVCSLDPGGQKAMEAQGLLPDRMTKLQNETTKWIRNPKGNHSKPSKLILNIQKHLRSLRQFLQWINWVPININQLISTMDLRISCTNVFAVSEQQFIWSQRRWHGQKLACRRNTGP